MNLLTIDCGTCAVRGPACGDCMVTAMLGPAEGVVEFAPDEVIALKAMTAGGLLPPLRLVKAMSPTRSVAHDGESVGSAGGVGR